MSIRKGEVMGHRGWAERADLVIRVSDPPRDIVVLRSCCYCGKALSPEKWMPITTEIGMQQPAHVFCSAEHETLARLHPDYSKAWLWHCPRLTSVLIRECDLVKFGLRLDCGYSALCIVDPAAVSRIPDVREPAQ